MHLREIEHIFALVADAVRQEFPTDYYKRCMYAALGIAALIRDRGVDARTAGGDFLAFVMSRDGRRG
jgi:hypothetical protein